MVRPAKKVSERALPSGLRDGITLGDYVFMGESVTNIAYNPFHGVSSITSLTVRATSVPTLGGFLCVSATFNGTIYVPAESLEDYKAASNWNTYSDRLAAIP